MADSRNMTAPATPTITCGTRTRLQPDAHARAGRLAAALQAAELEGGQRVAVMLRNDIEYLEIALGIATAGGNPVPVNTRWKAAEVAHLVGDASVRIVFAHTEFVPVVEAACQQAGIDPLIVEVAMPEETLAEAGLDPALATATGRHRLLEDWIAEHPEPVGHVEGAIVNSMGMIYTSGTTGTPKGVLRERMTPEQLLAMAGGSAKRMGLTPGGQMIVAGPMYHTSPSGVAVMSLRMGTNITIMPRWDSLRFLELVAERKIQQAKLVPTMLSRLLSLPVEVRARYDLSSLTHVIHSAAPCPPAIKRAAIDMFGPEVLWEFFGCTEAGTITWISGAEWLEHPGSVGRPVDGSAVLIADEDGNPLPAGQTGRVYVRGADYWPRFEYLGRGRPESPVPDMIWVGDLGHVDAEGWLYLTGRSSDVIIRGGVNIYPAEVENAIVAAVDGVEDVAVIGIPDTDGDLGEKVVAYLLPRAGATVTESAVLEALTPILANYKLPTAIEIVDELPRDDSGKIYRRQLIQRPVADTVG